MLNDTRTLKMHYGDSVMLNLFALQTNGNIRYRKIREPFKLAYKLYFLFVIADVMQHLLNAGTSLHAFG